MIAGTDESHYNHPNLLSADGDDKVVFRSKIALIIVITILSLTLSIYNLMYTQFYNLTIDGLKDDAHNIHRYVQSFVTEGSFLTLNTTEDEKTEVYTRLCRKLEEIRNIANVRRLYTAKQNNAGDYIYVADGFASDNDESLRHIGSLIDLQVVPDLKKCLAGQVVLGNNIKHTDRGFVYVAFFPVYGGSSVAGAIGMEFDCNSLHEAIAKTRGMTTVISLAFALVFGYIAVYASRKASDPLYKKLAFQDALTGLGNRTAFDERLKDYERQLNSTSFAMIVFDLNNLKGVNDTFGHSAGDEYIKNAAKSIKQAFDHLGETYRIGGDEFLTVITGHEESEMQSALKQLYKGNKTISEDFVLNCSFGLAIYDPAVDNSLHDLLDRADSKMYENKRSGGQAEQPIK